MKKFRKIGLAILALCIFVIIFSLMGCSNYREKEEGYYKYKIHEQNDGEKHIEITGLTELGKKQKVLVIPEDINGIKVKSLEKTNLFSFITSTGVRWKSENLEKVFFPTSRVSVYYGTFAECINIKRTFAINFNIEAGFMGGGGVLKAAIGNLYVPILLFDTDEYIHEKLKPANITYYYNYETDINYGVYWIDDEDYGSVIEYIPSDPIREGYEFGGWYKEAECINKWDFDKDTLPEEQLEEVEVEATLHEEAYTEMRQVYQETKLYAKWIKK